MASAEITPTTSYVSPLELMDRLLRSAQWAETVRLARESDRAWHETFRRITPEQLLAMERDAATQATLAGNKP